MSTKNYKDLIVWQKSMKLAKTIYQLVKKLPIEERYSLSDQMRRAAVSIPSNIAEGNARFSTKEYVRFLSIARGSNAEVETQLLLAVDCEMLEQSEVEEALELCEEIRRMLGAIISKLTKT